VGRDLRKILHEVRRYPLTSVQNGQSTQRWRKFKKYCRKLQPPELQTDRRQTDGSATATNRT